MKKQLTWCVGINAAIMIFLSAYALLIPAAMLIYDLRDPGLYSDDMPRFVFHWHRALSPKYEKWARRRVEAGAAAKLTTEDISGTEWPVFGSVFYLWARRDSRGDGSGRRPQSCRLGQRTLGRCLP
ncbi:MAG: hypothetical protein ACYS4T_19060 [Planctomycetota bacterium]|jgi:hypothetical protein